MLCWCLLRCCVYLYLQLVVQTMETQQQQCLLFFSCIFSSSSQSNALNNVNRVDAPARIVESIESDAVCREALNLFIECLACHLRLTALQLLPTGGLYICGGIPCRAVVLEHLKTRLSPGLFVDDVVMGEFLEKQISLHVVTNPNCGLLGAKIRALRLLQEDVVVDHM